MDDKPHSHRLRIGRRSEVGGCYLLTTCCNGRQARFANPEAADIVLDALHWLVREGRMELLAAVVMPDHLHLVAVLRHGSLGGLMHGIKRHAALAINRAETRSGGPLWQPGYHDRALRSDQAVEAAIGYCLKNPVRAGLVEDFREYPHWWCKFGLD
ncbi:transposase [Pseudoluteimonas lycopersici]|uniref:Transposase n=1 Tax=Pseudoluteimonas lycopersici TaxID=1324796 RepID=A0A516V571_9GAMM|nr:transposase [Lysobacter lycopersici]QDQ73674.1 transposase [Lysobacter lycopersici]